MLAKHLSKSEEAQAFRKNKWMSFQVDTCCSNPPHKISCRNSCFHGRLPHLFQVNRWIILQKVKLNRFTKPPLRKVNIVWLIIMKFFLWNGIPEILRACKLIVIRKPKNVRSLWSRVTQRKVLSWYMSGDEWSQLQWLWTHMRAQWLLSYSHQKFCKAVSAFIYSRECHRLHQDST